MAVEMRAGDTVAGYRVESLIGRGGMSHVYRAVQTSVDRLVALKILAPEWSGNDDFRRRFLAEARLAATIEHPNILPIYDAGEADDRLYIAMRLVDGTDLRRLLERDGHLPLARTITLIGAAAAALDAAHSRGLVHRDVKPANLLLAADQMYLADFGIAKIASARREFTRTGMFVGTLDYAAPEQIRNEEIDGRADLYSLGCVLCHCLAGAPPFDRPSEYGTMQAHLYDPPPSVRVKRPESPAAIDDVIATALAKQRDERFRTGRHFVAALREAEAGRRQPWSAGSVSSTVIAEPDRVRTAGLAQRRRRRSDGPTEGNARHPKTDAVEATTPARQIAPSATRSRLRLPAMAPLTNGEKMLAAAGFALCTIALFVPVWAITWPARATGPGPTPAQALPQVPSWLAVAGVGCALAFGGILWKRALAWGGLAILAASAILPNALGPLFRDAGSIPAPRYAVDLGFWLTIVGLFIALLGLLGPIRAWLRVVVVGIGLAGLSLATPTWAMVVPMDVYENFQPLRIFDPPDGAWAAVWVTAFAAICLGLGLRWLTAPGRPFALAVAATSITWAGMLSGALAVIWGLGFDRIRALLVAANRAVFLGESFWLAVLGIGLVSFGLILEVTTAEEPRQGRWNTVTRIFAPFRSPVR